MITDAGRVPLAQRAWVGDGARGALVAADGTIDWYLPYLVGGAACLWRLLDPRGGAVRVGPVRDATGSTRRLPPGTQRYRPGTNVVETILDGPGGRRVAVVDALPWPGPGLATPGVLIRLVEVLAGPVDIEIEVIPSGPWRPASEISVSTGGLVVDDIRIRCPIRLEADPLGRDEPRWRGHHRFDTGEAFTVTIGPLLDNTPVSAALARRQIADTETAWRSWLAGADIHGPLAAPVERALLAMRSLTGTSGAPLAAGTTSLPRRVGGEQNSDGRWAHVRDVAGAALAYAELGLAEDAEAAEGWLRTVLTDAPIPWPDWLDADGQPAPESEELGLAGWRKSQPVVTGRPDRVPDAGLLGALSAAIDTPSRGPAGRPGAPGPLSAAYETLRNAADWTTDHWRDTGLVASRMEAWAGLERMTRRARAANPLDLDAAAWHQEARQILEYLEKEAVTDDGGLIGGDERHPDEPRAELLSVAWSGPWPSSVPMVTRTVDRVLERLTSGGLLYRTYDPSDDSPDIEASLWAARALARLERWEEAYERIEAVTRLTGPAGILAEAADPVAGELLGNLPSTAAGVAFINAALALQSGPR